MSTATPCTDASTEDSDTPAFGDGLFFGYIQPDAFPALLLEAMLTGKPRTTGLPRRFLMPLAGPDGATLGHIEFAYHTTQHKRGRYAATALHTAQNRPLPDLPIVPTLTPMAVTEYVSCGRMRLLRDQARAVNEYDAAALARARERLKAELGAT